MYTPDMNDMIGILIGLSVLGSIGIIWWKHRKPKVTGGLEMTKAVPSATAAPAPFVSGTSVATAPDGTLTAVGGYTVTVPTVFKPMPPAAETAPAMVVEASAPMRALLERYVDRDDFMKDIGGIGPSQAVVLDGVTVHPGVAPAETYFTQSDGSIADTPVAAGLKPKVVEEPVAVVEEPKLPEVVNDWPPAFPPVPYVPGAQVPLMDSSSSKYVYIMRGQPHIGFNGKVFDTFNELILQFNAYQSEAWRWQLVNIQHNHAFLNYLMDSFSGPVMYNFEKAQMANPKQDSNFDPSSKPW